MAGSAIPAAAAPPLLPTPPSTPSLASPAPWIRRFAPSSAPRAVAPSLACPAPSIHGLARSPPSAAAPTASKKQSRASASNSWVLDKAARASLAPPSSPPPSPARPAPWIRGLATPPSSAATTASKNHGRASASESWIADKAAHAGLVPPSSPPPSPACPAHPIRGLAPSPSSIAPTASKNDSRASASESARAILAPPSSSDKGFKIPVDTAAGANLAPAIPSAASPSNSSSGNRSLIPSSAGKVQRQAKDVMKSLKKHIIHNNPKCTGVVFLQRLNDSAPIITPPQTQPLQNYPPLRISQQEEPQLSIPDFPALSLIEISNAHGIMYVLSEMLDALDLGKREGFRHDVIVDLVDQCCSYKQRVVQLVNNTSNEELLIQGLSLNDDMQRVLAKHDAIAAGVAIQVEKGLQQVQVPPTSLSLSAPPSSSNSKAPTAPAPKIALLSGDYQTRTCKLSGTCSCDPVTEYSA